MVLSDAIEFNVPGRVEVLRRAGTPIVMGRREGYRFWDIDGKELIDFHINGGVFNLGHRNPEVIESVVAGLDEYDVGNHHFPSVVRAALSRRLAELTPGDLQYSVFTPSGTEANDVAIRSARRATSRRPIIGISRGFYGAVGLSGAAGAATYAAEFLSDSTQDFFTVPFNDLAALEATLASRETAAVIVETIPATAGFPMPHGDYLPGVRHLCDAFGALLIADEVQTGMGRTGQLWAVDTFGVQPDILVAGKGLGGGVYPMAAAVLSPKIAGWLHDLGWAYVSSSGGSEIGCVVALKVLEITLRSTTRRNVAVLSEKIGEGLRRIASTDPLLAEVRQCGLVVGIQLDHSRGGAYLSRALYERGVWAYAAGFDQSVLQFKAGLLLDGDTCDQVLDRVEDALRAVRKRLKGDN
jgi:putrescine aminotransferase